LRVTLVPAVVDREDHFVHSVARMERERADALIAELNGVNTRLRMRILQLSAKNRIPTAFGTRSFAEAGGLLSYGADVSEHFRRAAGYVDRILKGAKPADLPVEQPTKFELVVNLKTAKALGLTIPPSVLARADHVIE
jgi:putative ABC transport system substrate-binding protein